MRHNSNYHRSRRRRRCRQHHCQHQSVDVCCYPENNCNDKQEDIVGHCCNFVSNNDYDDRHDDYPLKNAQEFASLKLKRIHPQSNEANYQISFNSIVNEETTSSEAKFRKINSSYLDASQPQVLDLQSKPVTAAAQEEIAILLSKPCLLKVVPNINIEHSRNSTNQYYNITCISEEPQHQKSNKMTTEKQESSTPADDDKEESCKILTDLDAGKAVIVAEPSPSEHRPPESPCSERDTTSPLPIISQTTIAASPLSARQASICSNKRFKKSHHNHSKIREPADIEESESKENLHTHVQNEIKTPLSSTSSSDRVSTGGNDEDNHYVDNMNKQTVLNDDETKICTNLDLKLLDKVTTRETKLDVNHLGDKQHSLESNNSGSSDSSDLESIQEEQQIEQRYRYHDHYHSSSAYECPPAKLTEQQREQLDYLMKIIKGGTFNEFVDLIGKQNFTLSLLNVYVNGQTALHYSLICGRNLAWCKQLVTSGANPNLTNRAGWHPIHLAAYGCSTETLNYLCDCVEDSTT